MQSANDDNVDPRANAWWTRLHVALMPDYNRRAASFWWLLVIIGSVTLMWAAKCVALMPWSSQMQVIVGTLIAAGAGFFPLRVPHSKNSFVAGEIFIFLLLLINSTEAAVIAATGEALVGSWRTSKRWTSRIVSPSVAAVSMLIVGTLLHAALNQLEHYGFANQGLVLTVSMVCAVVYFLITATLVSTVLRLKRNAPFDVKELFNNFTWVGITYAGSASIAALLFLSFKQTGIGVLLAAAPVLAMLLSTLHYYFRQQETAQAAQRTRVDSAMREAEVAARHMREMAESERRFHSAFTHASIGMALVTVEGRVLQANLSLEAILGFSASELIGRDFSENIMTAERHLLRTQLQRAHRHEVEAFGVELNCLHKDGRDVSVSLHCSFFSEPHSSAPCLILQVQDISARRQAESQLQHIAFHDGLTGLPNRRRFNQLLEQAVERCKRNTSDSYAVMFIDCDRFKVINDSMGHAVGDDFLVYVARRIQERVRPTDIVSRLGGDEFAVLLHGFDSVDSVQQLADRLLHAMRQPMMVGAIPLTSSISIGMTFSSLGYESRGDVLRDADLAMYRAKSLGKDRYVVFDEGMRQITEQRMVLEGELRMALAKGTLAVAYQPLFNIRSGILQGFEALCRWHHENLGTIAPSIFIPMAEEIGVITDITEFMLHQATLDLRQWQRMHPSFADLQVHVNVAANDLTLPDFVGRVSRALNRAQLQPKHLVVELTENILMDRIEGGLAVLDDIRALGVELAIDDFGTGFSSLSSLSRLPINSLKIDASFVRELKAGSKQAEIVRAIVSLGSTLGKCVIAEGIESHSQMALLDDIGCEGGQGYLLSHPLPADDIVKLLLQRLEADQLGILEEVDAAVAVLAHH